MIYVNNNNNPAKIRIDENTRATAEKNAALLEYVAIMADVELPEDDDDTESTETEEE